MTRQQHVPEQGFTTTRLASSLTTSRPRVTVTYQCFTCRDSRQIGLPSAAGVGGERFTFFQVKTSQFIVFLRDLGGKKLHKVDSSDSKIKKKIRFSTN